MTQLPRPKMLRPLLSAVLLGAACLAASPARADGPESVRVMSFNLWHGGDAGKQPLDATVEVIRRSRADVVGLQETGGTAPKGEERPDRAAEIAERLGWHYLDQGGRTGVISRFPIVAATPRKWGAKLALPSGRLMYAFNVHLAHAPYQPYQLLRIPYADGAFLGTADEAVRAAREARGGQVAEMLAEVAAVAAEGLPMVVTGDFNEPSHRDWTDAAASAGIHPLRVEWPSTLAVEAAGFVDAYREVHPDPLASPGVTWTPITRPDDPKDHHDRIDFVLATPNVQVKSAEIVGESREAADIVVTPYPSDHRAVVAELLFPEVAPSTPGE
ncbi:endonuclease/exonuclease/phosphatase family protein [Paludisphaera sp.]|uniref:endonuclease/exonuclease/phosphatase family protein n=1 Tax=Paludisphaera sp. TaxID=2017432 RepID=UPI00301D83AE